MLLPPPPPPPATTTRVAKDAAVANALGPETVPLVIEPAKVAVLTVYEKVLFAALMADTVNVPLNSVPTPATITLSPTLKP
jgi:hypothetical protein